MSTLRDLELRHVIALDAVATEGTFGRAALRLGYTQSAVSQQIAALERIVGGALFDRPGGPKPVTLTPLGQLVLTHARDIIARVDAAGEAVARFQAGDGGRLEIGTFQSVSNMLLPAIVGRLLAEHPALDIRLFEDDEKMDSQRRVEAGELDLTFTVGRPGGVLDSIVLLDDPFVLVAKAGDLAQGPYPTSQLDRVQMVGSPVTSCQQEIEDGLRANNVNPHYVFRTIDNGAQIAMVRAGMGWSVMPLLAVDTRDPGVDIRLLTPPLPPRQICIAWNRQRTLSPCATRALELAHDAARELRQLAAIA